MTREEAISIITKERDEDIFGGWTPHRKRIHEAFTLAIEALQADRPRGEWIDRKEEVDGFLFIGRRCSNCGWWESGGFNLPFCPNCGAKMDGGEQ